MRKTEGFQALFLKTHTKNEREVLYFFTIPLVFSVVPKCDSLFDYLIICRISYVQHTMYEARGEQHDNRIHL